MVFQMRFYRKKFLIALLCLAASAGLTWKLFEIVDSSKETVILVQVSRRLEEGTRVSADMLCRVEVGAYGVDGRALKTDEGIIGKYAACDLYPGDMLTADKFRTIDETADKYVLKTRENSLSAVSVELKGVSAGLSGKLKTGDVVSAFVFVSEGGMGSNKGDVIVYPELQYLEIAAVTNNRAEDIHYEPERDIDYDRVRATGDSAIPATVIFIVDEQQAVRLVEAENTGAIHLVFRGRGEYAQELLNNWYGAPPENSSSAEAGSAGGIGSADAASSADVAAATDGAADADGDDSTGAEAGSAGAAVADGQEME